jgi:hypothetical protein
MCNINKNRLLTVYFHEGTDKEEREIGKHIDQCDECRDYLALLGKTDNTLLHWKEEKPLPKTLDLILETIPREQPKEVEATSGAPVVPLLALLFSIIGIFNIISFVHEKITMLPFWSAIADSWPVRFLGSFGVTAILFFLVGIFLTLALTPVLILDAQSKKNRYNFG